MTDCFRIQRDLARKRAAEEDERNKAALEEARRLAAEREEEERRRRQMAMGKRTFLRKGEGHIAAHESGKVTQDKEAEEKAKKDIASYSLQHAKKGGLIKPSTANRTTSGSTSGNYDQSGGGDESFGDGSTGGGKRSRPTSSTSHMKGGMAYKEMDKQFDNKWDDAWTEEDELNFLKARGS